MSKKSKVVSGLMWTFGERIGSQGVSFIVSIILARILLPEEYGLISLVTIFISIANTFVTGGFGSSLIQKKDADDVDFSTVFYFNIVFSILIYLLLYMIAPSAAKYFGQEKLALVLRVMGLQIIIAGINSVQQAYVSKNMIFKRFFFATLIGTAVSAAVGITIALKGYGVWSLVVQYMVNTTINTSVLWFTVKWRPKKYFSMHRLKSLFSFGWKLLISSLLSTIYMDLYSFVIGKIYSSKDLAYYNRGKKFPELISTNINSALNTVLFPAMSLLQSDVTQLKSYVRKSISLGSFIVFPIMFGMAAIANTLVLVLLTDKWLPSVIYLQIACISFSMIPINMANIQVIKALGRSDIYLKLDIVKKVIGLVFLIIFFRRGVIAITIAEVCSNFVGVLINTFPNKKLINYSLLEQLKDIIPQFILSMVMAIVILFIELIPINKIILLSLQILLGGFVYAFGAYIIKLDTFCYFISLIKSSKYEVKVKIDE
jgi:O-antigen/teichoic acid export membrane protein